MFRRDLVEAISILRVNLVLDWALTVDNVRDISICPVPTKMFKYCTLCSSCLAPSDLNLASKKVSFVLMPDIQFEALINIARVSAANMIMCSQTFKMPTIIKYLTKLLSLSTAFSRIVAMAF